MQRPVVVRRFTAGMRNCPHLRRSRSSLAWCLFGRRRWQRHLRRRSRAHTRRSNRFSLRRHLPGCARRRSRSSERISFSIEHGFGWRHLSSTLAIVISSISKPRRPGIHSRFVHSVQTRPVHHVPLISHQPHRAEIPHVLIHRLLHHCGLPNLIIGIVIVGVLVGRRPPCVPLDQLRQVASLPCFPDKWMLEQFLGGGPVLGVPLQAACHKVLKDLGESVPLKPWRWILGN